MAPLALGLVRGDESGAFEDDEDETADEVADGLAPVDLYVLVRDELAPRRFFRKSRDVCLANADALRALLSSARSMEASPLPIGRTNLRGSAGGHSAGAAHGVRDACCGSEGWRGGRMRAAHLLRYEAP
jgi:hypothetical protein